MVVLGCVYCFLGGCEGIVAVGMLYFIVGWVRAKWHKIRCKCVCHECKCGSEKEVKHEEVKPEGDRQVQ